MSINRSSLSFVRANRIFQKLMTSVEFNPVCFHVSCDVDATVEDVDVLAKDDGYCSSLGEVAVAHEGVDGWEVAEDELEKAGECLCCSIFDEPPSDDVVGPRRCRK